MPASHAARRRAADDRYDDLEQFVTYQILNLTARLNRQSTRLLEETSELRMPEWRCISIIGRKGKTNLLSISGAIGMDRGLVSRTVQSLTEKGLVLTERDTADRRVVFARLTPTGKKAFDTMYPVMQARQRRLLSALSPGDRKAFYRIMQRFNATLEEWPEEWRQSDD